MSEYKRLSKYIRGMAKTLEQLAVEIEQDKDLTKESKDLLSKIGSGLLYKSCSFAYIKD
jgi:hypothetical protein